MLSPCLVAGRIRLRRGKVSVFSKGGTFVATNVML